MRRDRVSPILHSQRPSQLPQPLSISHELLSFMFFNKRPATASLVDSPSRWEDE